MADSSLSRADIRVVAIHIALLLALSLTIMSPGLVLELPITHSNSFNVSWLRGFAEELGRGHLYPRWLPGMSEGLGSPVFYFYAPLPFYVSSPFYWITGEPALSIHLGCTLLLWLSGLTSYFLFREWASPSHALLAAQVYVLAPYHLVIDVWVRGAIGEVAAYGFVPVIVLGILRLGRTPYSRILLSIGVFGLVMSHLPTALYMLPLLALFGIFHSFKTRSIIVAVDGVTSAFLGICLAAVYLLPAAFETGMIHSELWKTNIPLGVTMPWQLQTDFMALLSITEAPVALAFLYLSVFHARSASAKEAAPWMVAGWLVLFLTSSFAHYLWENSGFFRNIQFSWRMFLLLDLVLCILLVLGLDHRIRGMIAISMVLITVTTASLGFVVLTNASTDSSYLKWRESRALEVSMSADAVEYLPRCLETSNLDFVYGSSNVQVLKALAEVSSSNNIKLFYYPFLTASDGVVQLALTCDTRTGLARVSDTFFDGVDVHVEHVPLLSERIGNWISIVSVITLLGSWVYGKIRAHGLTRR